MQLHTLDKHSSTLYKGIAILLIVLHNFMHKLSSAKEMEFSFSEHGFDNFLLAMQQTPYFSTTLLSYFGHYGVQIFIFLSAYGLTKRYFNNDLTFKPYIFKRIKTIYPAFLIAFGLYFILTGRNLSRLSIGLPEAWW